MTARDSHSRDKSRPRLYAVATVHLDTQWRWTIQDTIREFIPATLERNFDLLERYPFFVVSFEGAFRYQLMQEYYPEEFEKLRRWVSKGRWRVAGSMLDSPDVNVISPESLIRHILYGNGFFRSELGVSSCDIFLPDCFGFGQALPSVAAHCGLTGFSAQKFGRWMAPATIPFDVGVWQGPDSEEVVAAIRPGGYGEGLDEDLSRAPRFLERLEVAGRECGVAVGLRYVGVGDRGGGLDESSMRWLDKSVHGDGPVEVVLSGSDQIFRDLSREQITALPRHADELLLPTHGTGCLTSQAQLKRWNRRNELLADAAERAASIADLLGALPYPAARLRGAWTRFLWHQMHDDLTGTSIPEAYSFTDNDELLSLNQFAAVLTHAIGSLAAAMDTRCVGQPLVVFNPLSIERQDVVTIDLPPEIDTGVPTSVIAPDGRELPAQLTTDINGQRSLIFLARVPALGLQIYDIRFGTAPTQDSAELSVSSTSLANHRYRVRFDNHGDIVSVFDRSSNRELLAAPIQLQLIRDRSARWPAWEILYEDLLQADPEVVRGSIEVRVVEDGPVRTGLEITRSTRGSTFRQLVRLAAGDAGSRVEIDHLIDWRTRGRLLKARFSLAACNPQATFDLGLGVIQRGNRQRQKYEVPAQQWAAINDSRLNTGVSILNDCKYGWDKPDDSTLRLSLLRSPRVLRKFRHQGPQDYGQHRFTLGLYGHLDDWEIPASSWQAARLNQPLMAFATSAHPGRLGREISFVDTETDQIMLQALKLSEAGDGWVARFRELAGSSAHASIGLGNPMLAATNIDGSEISGDPASVRDHRLEARFGPFSLRSYSIQIDRTTDGTVESRSRAISLPFDRVATRPRGTTDKKGFDGRGHSIPAEIWPEHVEYGGVRFDLRPGDDDHPNAVACRGQKLDLSGCDLDRLHLLATSTEKNTSGAFNLGGTSEELDIGFYSGFLGRRSTTRSWLGGWRPERPPTLGADQPVAWIGTHRLDAHGCPEPYVFCYLFAYSLEIPSDGATLTLPEDPQIHIFAMIATDSRVTDTRPARALYD